MRKKNVNAANWYRKRVDQSKLKFGKAPSHAIKSYNGTNTKALNKLGCYSPMHFGVNYMVHHGLGGLEDFCQSHILR